MDYYYDASVVVVEALINTWSDVVRTRDDSNWFPIRYTVACTSLEVIELVLNSWPVGIQSEAGC